MNFYDVPVYINARDRLTDLSALVDWLENAGYQRLVLIDVDSSYPPLLDYLADSDHEVVILHENLGSRAPWKAGIVPNEWFAYTDCDILPIEECPTNIVEHLYQLLQRNHTQPNGIPYSKAGLSLKNDDVPDPFPSKAWEQGPEINGAVLDHTGARDSLVDTTFALYRPSANFELQAIRSGHPYQARHMGWYRRVLDEEHRYYLDHALHGPGGTTSWERKAA